MKQKLLNKLLTLTLLILGGALFSPAWGEDISLTTSVIEITNFSNVGSSYPTSATNKTVGGYTWSVYNCMNLGKYKGVTYNNLQMKSGVGYITSPIISSSSGFTVTVTYSSTKALTLQIGSETAQTGGTTSSNAPAGTGATVTATTTSTSTTFKLSAGSATAYVSSIVITPNHKLTYSAANGSISGVVYGTSTAVTSGASIEQGGKVTLTATPSDGYEFSSWSVEGTGSSLSSTTDNPTTFTMGTANATVTANFTATGGTTTYSVTYNANDATSGDVPTDNNEYEEGDEVTVLGNTGSLAKTGFAFGGWNTKSDGLGDNYDEDDTFEITANTTLYAKWVPYEITAVSNNESYGTVSREGLVITGSPKSGYRYASPAYTVSPENSATVDQDGNAFTVTPSANTTVTINFEAIPTHTATFSVNGNTTAQDFAEGASIIFPSDPADISGKKFVGWATDAITGTTDEAPSFVTSATMGNEDITYYAVFADAEESSETKQDALTSSVTGITTSSYTNFSDKSVSGGSNATYAGNCAGSNSYIQLRTSSNTGLVSTTSGGKVKKVTLVWNSTSDRALHIYGSNTAYTGISDIFDDKKKGTLLGTLTYNSDTELSITGNYAYIGIKPDANKSGASQLSSITIDWEVSNITYSNYCTSVVVAYSVTYDANGATSGDVPTDETAYSPNATVTVLGNTGSLAKTGFDFGGWNTKSDGSGDNYDEDDTFEITANTTLYAKWVPYEITAVSNNESYGTVSREGLVITGSPKSGYRYASPAYSVTSGYATVAQEGNEFTVTPTSDCTVRINFEAIPTHTATFSVNGSTTSQDFAEGASITFPEDPDDVSGKKFVGWATDAISGTTDEAPSFVTSATMGNEDITYYAVFADASGSAVTDELTTSTFGSPSSYTSWSNKQATNGSNAKYAGNSTTYENSAIQIRTTNSTSGIVSTTSGGKATKVTVTWNSATADDRTLDIYGKNTAYTGASDLYGDDKGTKLGSLYYEVLINNVKTTTTELTIDGNYQYIGLRSKNNAMYLDEIDIQWSDITYSNYCTSVVITYSVTVGTAGYATYASDNDLDFTDSNIKAYIAKAKDDGTGVTFDRVYKIPAGTGVLLYKDGGAEEAIPVTTESTDNVTNNVFVRGEGVAVASEDDNKRNYILSKVNNVVGFYRANNKVVAKNRAYIQVESASLAKDFISMPGFDDSTTGVNEVNGSGLMVNGPVYDLQGRRIEKPVKGLYIVNGKKILKY